MRNVREVLRQKLVLNLSNHAVAESCAIGRSTVSKYLARIQKAGLNWAMIQDMSDEELEQVVDRKKGNHESLAIPDWSKIHKELKKKGVTIQLLWDEYIGENPKGYRYSHFCHLYQEWRLMHDLPMHQEHKAGDKMFVDYCGQTMPVIDKESGDVHQAEIFVSVLGASSYTYAEAFWSQSLSEWIAAHVHAFEFFGGVPDQVVPDNLKSGVTTAHRYEPEINRTYEEMAQHYGCAIVPARVRRPKDKAKVEKGVQDVERRILAPLQFL